MSDRNGEGFDPYEEQPIPRDAMSDSGLHAGHDSPYGASDETSAPVEHQFEPLTASEFDTSPFEGRVPVDASERDAVVSTFMAIHDRTVQAYPDFQDVDFVASREGILREMSFAGEVSDETTLARITVAHGNMVTGEPAESSQIIIKRTDTQGQPLSFDYYYIREDGAVYKDKVDLLADSIRPRANEMSSREQRDVITQLARERRGLYRDAVAAGLMRIPVGIDEMTHVERFVSQVQPQTISFGQIHTYILERATNPSFNPAALEEGADPQELHKALGLIEDSKAGALAFTRYTARRIQEGADKIDSTTGTLPIEVPADSMTAPATLGAQLTLGYEEGVPYAQMTAQALLIRPRLEAIRSYCIERGIPFPEELTSGRLHSELRVTVDSDDCLRMSHQLTVLSDDRRHRVTYAQGDAIADKSVAGFLRNFYRNPVFNLRFKV